MKFDKFVRCPVCLGEFHSAPCRSESRWLWLATVLLLAGVGVLVGIAR